MERCLTSHVQFVVLVFTAVIFRPVIYQIMYQKTSCIYHLCYSLNIMFPRSVLFLLSFLYEQFLLSGHVSSFNTSNLGITGYKVEIECGRYCKRRIGTVEDLNLFLTPV